jgi:hypothetical protein
LRNSDWGRTDDADDNRFISSSEPSSGNLPDHLPIKKVDPPECFSLETPLRISSYHDPSVDKSTFSLIWSKDIPCVGLGNFFCDFRSDIAGKPTISGQNDEPQASPRSWADEISACPSVIGLTRRDPRPCLLILVGSWWIHGNFSKLQNFVSNMKICKINRGNYSKIFRTIRMKSVDSTRFVMNEWQFLEIWNFLSDADISKIDPWDLLKLVWAMLMILEKKRLKCWVIMNGQN